MSWYGRYNAGLKRSDNTHVLVTVQRLSLSLSARRVRVRVRVLCATSSAEQDLEKSQSTPRRATRPPGASIIRPSDVIRLQYLCAFRRGVTLAWSSMPFADQAL